MNKILVIYSDVFPYRYQQCTLVRQNWGKRLKILITHIDLLLILWYWKKALVISVSDSLLPERDSLDWTVLAVVN